ncbi:inositol monophosphatase family protein [Chengkuizengella marina]|uniref:Inositol-1-monophosphatase n=1 Tax=Chengkuizengella marina TaxID=2507566 RepID=A0A6N9Q638_9BACL|nr:inositol monophosphatase family protein [Chengkuizengella marina]NBI30161.1 inositol monophosphatase [Chengkuizengella marina]
MYTVGRKNYTVVAINTASKAGEWIKSRCGKHSNIKTKLSSHDLVTEVDKGCETMIRNLLLTYFPDHSFLGEEGVEVGPEASVKAVDSIQEAEYVWIVDPIDGTTNFVHGFPFYSVSIALAHKGEVILGVVYDPVHDEMFVAEKGKGAYLRGQKMEISKENELSSSLLGTGFPVQQNALTTNLKGIQALSNKVRNIRTTGSAALHLAYVAAGRMSGFWELELNAWDIAAGALLIKESGGEVTDTKGEPYQLCVRNVLATNGLIHQSLQKELVSAEATGF